MIVIHSKVCVTILLLLSPKVDVRIGKMLEAMADVKRPFDKAFMRSGKVNKRAFVSPVSEMTDERRAKG